MSMLTPDELKALLPAENAFLAMHEVHGPRCCVAEAQYEKHGPARSNLRYGYVVRG